MAGSSEGDDIDRIADRLAEDDDFRARLREDPEAAFKSIEPDLAAPLSDEQWDAVRSADWKEEKSDVRARVESIISNTGAGRHE